MKSKLNWLARHGVRVRRAGNSWVARMCGHVININHDKHELIKLTFRELTMS